METITPNEVFEGALSQSLQRKMNLTKIPQPVYIQANNTNTYWSDGELLFRVVVIKRLPTYHTSTHINTGQIGY